MMMRKSLLTALFFCAGTALAQAPVGEQLFLIPPAGWTIAFHDVKDNIETTKLVPPGQNIHNYSDMLTVELIQGRPMQDTQTTLKARLEPIHADCDDLGAGPPQLAAENGYDTGLRAIACPKTKSEQRGLIGLYKIILGKDRTYMIGRSWIGKSFDKDKIPLPAQTSDEWLAFMKNVTVCDPRERTHPCPLAK